MALFIEAVLKVVKLVEGAHEKKMSVIASIPTRIRVAYPKADTGTYMNRTESNSELENVYKKGDSWYWVVK